MEWVNNKESDMAPEELLTVLRERPFQPFRIALTDGRTFDVRHPEMVLAGRRSAVIGLPAANETEPLYDRRITVDLLHISSMEPIQTPAKPNGQV
jgi:hypothetical protein